MKKNNRELFVSSNSDSGIYVKILKNKVVFSFWGDEDPRCISFSKEDAARIAGYIAENTHDTEEDDLGADIFSETFLEVQKRIPRHEL